jgi:two-component sensor histidine kinase
LKWRNPLAGNAKQTFIPLAVPEGSHHGERDKAAEAVAVAKEGVVAQFEGQAATAKGNVRWWEVNVSPIIGKDGRPVRLLSISRDVTARHLLERQRRLLFEEMHHRIKNTIATVQGIAQQTLRRASDLGTASHALGQRLVALGKAHDLLIRNEWISADMRQIVTDAVQAYVGDGARMSVSGDSIEISSRAALSLAMLLNELCTNAVKYGAWSSDRGTVHISWNKEGDLFRFCWIERDVPSVIPPQKGNFGMLLIADALPAALGGQGLVSFGSDGLAFELEAPLSALSEN